MIRVLGPGDEAALEEFLAPLADSSMFLLANSRKAGLVDRGLPFQATYAAAFAGERIVGVAAHSWLGTLLVQAPRELAGVARAAAAASGRQVTGVIGPFQQALAACEALGAAAPSDPRRDLLFALPLRELRVPPQLKDGSVVCRAPRAEEMDRLAEWRSAYVLETGLEPPGPDLGARSRVSIELLRADGSLFVLEHGGAVAALTAFNARIAEMVQVGGVYTPPDLRSRGYARCAVAGSLLTARSQGAERAILFTEQANVPAQRSYRALGFGEIGDYGLILLR
jgi:GNAT superfamily N-acetyltransferase